MTLKDKFHTIMSYNTKVIALQMYLDKYDSMAYTNASDVRTGIEVTYMVNKVMSEFQEFLDSLTKEDKEELKKLGEGLKNDPEIKELYKYADEQTKEDIKEVFGVNMTLDEFIWYLNDY